MKKRLRNFKSLTVTPCILIYLSVGIIYLAPLCAKAQNLVPNGSFETYTSCPTSQAQLSVAFPWVMPPNCGGASSDYFNACNGSSQGVPSNVVGYQVAKTGVAYAGVYTYGAACREYLQVPLTSPMVAGVIYKLEMYVSPSEEAGYVIDGFGMYVSAGAIAGNGTVNALAYTPQVSNPAGVLMADTVNWILIAGNYTAIGGEDYITIGNFKDDATTQFQIINATGWNRGYYLIDDVSVVVDSTTSLNEHNLNSVSVYPTLFHHHLNVYTASSQPQNFILYDVLGKKVLSQQLTISNSKLQTSTLSNGVYIYEIRNSAGVIKKGKVVKQ